jgi:hypothetical protein
MNLRRLRGQAQLLRLQEQTALVYFTELVSEGWIHRFFLSR